MRKILLSIFLVAALACNAAAAGGAPSAKPAKDLCLLDSHNCPGNFSYDIVEKVRRLNAAIKAGEAVYTAEEVEHLKNIRAELRTSLDYDNNDFLYEE